MVDGVRGDSHTFDLWPADLHPQKVECVRFDRKDFLPVYIRIIVQFVKDKHILKIFDGIY